MSGVSMRGAEGKDEGVEFKRPEPGVLSVDADERMLSARME